MAFIDSIQQELRVKIQPDFEDVDQVMQVLIRQEKPSNILSKIQELKDGGTLKLSEDDMRKFATQMKESRLMERSSRNQEEVRKSQDLACTVDT